MDTIQDEGIDIIQLLSKFVSRWYLYIIALIVCLLLAYAKIKTSPKVYEVYAILKMNVGSSKSDKILNSVELDKSEVNIQDKIIEIKSTNYIKETLNQLDFGISYFTNENFVQRERYKLDFPVNVSIDSSINILTDIPFYINIISNEEFELEFEIKDLLNATLYNFSEKIEIKQQYPNQKFVKTYQFNKPIIEPSLGLGFTITLVGDPKKYEDNILFFKINNPNGLIQAYLEMLNLEITERESSILYLKTGSSIVQKEIAFLNTLMDVVIKKNLEQKNQEYLKTIDFIDFQIANVSTSLIKAESDLESIGYATTKIGETSILFEQRRQLETQISSYTVQLQNLRNILSNLDNIAASAISTGSSDIKDPMIDKLIIKLTDLFQQRANLRRTATEANPVIQRINGEIETTKVALRNALNGALNNLNVLIENLKYRLQQTKANINRLPGAERKKLGIQRKFEFSDNTYELFMQRKATAGIALATNESDWKIIENAKVNTYMGLLSPNVKFIYLLAIFAGLFIPSIIILIVDMFDNRIKSKKEIEKITNIPIIGSIVKGDKNKKLITQYSTKSALTESIRDIKINLQFVSSDSNQKIIGITSSVSGEGKTFCAVNLGAVTAQSGKKVLVLDADMRNSKMGTYFNAQKSKHGFSSYLIGTSNIDEIIQPSPIKNLDIIFAGPFPPNPSDLLGLPKASLLLKELYKKYDYIIVDFPPIGLVGDYMILSKYIDINIYISRYKFTLKKSFEKINNLYNDKKLENMIIILNDVKVDTLYGSNPYYLKDYK